MDIIKKIEKEGRKGFNAWVLHETRDAQKKFGFDMTQKEGAYSNTIMKQMLLNMHICLGF